MRKLLLLVIAAMLFSYVVSASCNSTFRGESSKESVAVYLADSVTKDDLWKVSFDPPIKGSYYADELITIKATAEKLADPASGNFSIKILDAISGATIAGGNIYSSEITTTTTGSGNFPATIAPGTYKLVAEVVNTTAGVTEYSTENNRKTIAINIVERPFALKIPENNEFLIVLIALSVVRLFPGRREENEPIARKSSMHSIILSILT